MNFILQIMQLLVGIATVGVFIVYLYMLWAMQGQTRAQNFFSLASFLQTPDVRRARDAVLGWDAGKRYPADWTEDDKFHGSTVCSSYDVAAIAYYTGQVDGESFRGNWGPSIRDCYKVLKPFLKDRQISRGTEYWDDFERLGEELVKSS